jgi:hypothetical protein
MPWWGWAGGGQHPAGLAELVRIRRRRSAAAPTARRCTTGTPGPAASATRLDTVAAWREARSSPPAAAALAWCEALTELLRARASATCTARGGRVCTARSRRRSRSWRSTAGTGSRSGWAPGHQPGRTPDGPVSPRPGGTRDEHGGGSYSFSAASSRRRCQLPDLSGRGGGRRGWLQLKVLLRTCCATRTVNAAAQVGRWSAGIRRRSRRRGSRCTCAGAPAGSPAAASWMDARVVWAALGGDGPDQPRARSADHRPAGDRRRFGRPDALERNIELESGATPSATSSCAGASGRCAGADSPARHRICHQATSNTGPGGVHRDSVAFCGTGRHRLYAPMVNGLGVLGGGRVGSGGGMSASEHADPGVIGSAGWPAARGQHRHRPGADHRRAAPPVWRSGHVRGVLRPGGRGPWPTGPRSGNEPQYGSTCAIFPSTR